MRDAGFAVGFLELGDLVGLELPDTVCTGVLEGDCDIGLPVGLLEGLLLGMTPGIGLPVGLRLGIPLGDLVRTAVTGAAEGATVTVPGEGTLVGILVWSDFEGR